jgi:predicted anti-sigma-YlaC factor YlaD
MADHCPSAFDESLISGYLDGELTQATEQKVRIHLEDCMQCRTLLEDLRSIREAAMSTEFSKPDDTQWDERPQGGTSLVARGAGWILIAVWTVVVGVYAIWEFIKMPASPLERLLVVGGLTALALLFVSVLLDRIRTARTDPYREVEK